MMKNRLPVFAFFALVFGVFLVGQSYSIEYYNSDDIFTSEIVRIENMGDFRYEVILEINNYYGDEMEFDVEVLYDPESLVLGAEKTTCGFSCRISLDIEKTFFGEYTLIIVGNSGNRFYKQELFFELEPEEVPYDIVIEPEIVLDAKQGIVIDGTIENFLGKNSNFIFEIFPLSAPNNFETFEKSCSDLCDFRFVIDSQIVIDEYNVNVYSMLGDVNRRFKLELPYQIGGEKKLILDFSERANKKDPEIYFKQGSNNTIEDFFFYNNVSENDFEIRTSILKGGKKQKEENIDFEEIYDIDFEVSSSSVKEISVLGVRVNDILLGFEDVAVEKVSVSNTVLDAFAIDPKFDESVSEYFVTFTAKGNSVLKCEDYNFSTQTCFGDFEKILDTMPGKDYTLRLTPVDPLIIQVDDYILPAASALCQSLGGGWSFENCDDVSYSGDDVCPVSGGLGEYTFCTDGFYESHDAKLGLPSGIRMFFGGSSNNCDAIVQVEVLYNVWWEGGAQGIRTLSIDADGDGWTSVPFVVDEAQPSFDRIVDVTNSLEGNESWDCSDFFGDFATAGIELFRNVSSGGSDDLYTLNVDTIVYRVTYNSTMQEILTDRSYYPRGENVSINGSFWTNGRTVIINVTRPDFSVDSFSQEISSGNFNFLYEIGETFPAGKYLVFAYLENSSNVNATSEFEVYLTYDSRLQLRKNITRVDDDVFNVIVEVFNLDDDFTASNKNIVVYGFVSKDFTVSDFFYFSASDWYDTAYDSRTIDGGKFNGTIFQWMILDDNEYNSSLAGFEGVSNSDNSWAVQFNMTGIGEYNFKDIFMVGFDPVEKVDRSFFVCSLEEMQTFLNGKTGGNS